MDILAWTWKTVNCKANLNIGKICAKIPNHARNCLKKSRKIKPTARGLGPGSGPRALARAHGPGPRGPIWVQTGPIWGPCWAHGDPFWALLGPWALYNSRSTSCAGLLVKLDITLDGAMPIGISKWSKCFCYSWYHNACRWSRHQVVPCILVLED